MGWPPAPRWDIFCRVIDNFGDAGVAWRLARQLAQEHVLEPRLIIDDLAPLAKLCHEVDSASTHTRARGVEIVRWTDPFEPMTPGDVVIEMFGCRPPDSYLDAMARRQPAPVWINLDYLSAEAWVEGCHRLPSPDPVRPLTKYFFYPGFTPRTGGLLRERDLLERRERFLGDPAAQHALWASLGTPPPARGELRVSLFCYDTAPVDALFELWAGGTQRIVCVVAQGVAERPLNRLFGRAPRAGDTFSKGALTVAIVPFVEQEAFDPILWACDVNFVRGEDSFVRAQWAAKPMVWQAYPQADEAHLAKLTAFVERATEALDADAANAWRTWLLAWNHGELSACDWADVVGRLPALTAHTRWWAERLAAQRDLTSALLELAAEKR